jgi:hypothetical protein
MSEIQWLLNVYLQGTPPLSFLQGPLPSNTK